MHCIIVLCWHNLVHHQNDCTGVQSQKAVFDHFTYQQILPSGYLLGDCLYPTLPQLTSTTLRYLLYKPCRPKISFNNLFDSFRAAIVFIRQNLTSKDSPRSERVTKCLAKIKIKSIHEGRLHENLFVPRDEKKRNGFNAQSHMHLRTVY